MERSIKIDLIVFKSNHTDIEIWNIYLCVLIILCDIYGQYTILFWHSVTRHSYYLFLLKNNIKRTTPFVPIMFPFSVLIYYKIKHWNHCQFLFVLLSFYSLFSFVMPKWFRALESLDLRFNKITMSDRYSYI